MELPSWQERLAEAPADAPSPAKVSFLTAKKFFAVDASGSTIGPVMRAQAKAVWGLRGNSSDTVTKWDTLCENPQLLDNVPIDYFYGNGGTQPSSIIQNGQAVDAIRSSDLWILLTDGAIYESGVAELTRLAEEMDVLQVPVVLVITGKEQATPAQTAISVGIPFFASAREALIIFKDYHTGRLSLIDAKGSFAPLKSDIDIDLSSWASLVTYANEEAFNKHCEEMGVVFVQGNERLATRAVSLGPEWDIDSTNALVNVPALLEEKQLRVDDLRNLLKEEAINQLALICKIRGQLGTLRNLILSHKQQEVIARLEDRHGAGEIMEKLQHDALKPEDKDKLLDQLRQAHKANRETYAALRDCPSEESRRVSEMNKLIDRALRIISGLEKSSYTANILDRKSNRAMRAEVVSAADGLIHLASLDLSDNLNPLKGICSICCGEEQIMSIVLKRLAKVEDNTTDFALNFPLAAGHAKQNADMVSSQCICFQCALILSPRSIYQEDVIAVIPTIQYEGLNKKYIDHQLTLAITNGLATGASGTLQIFMTILDKTLATKTWCSANLLESDVEVSSRREILIWTLKNMLLRCKCQENFTGTGNLVDYPRALIWAVKDYEEARLDSWIIQYPVAGFNQLMRWYDQLSLPVKPETLEAIQVAKLFNLIVTLMMRALFEQTDHGRSWTYPFLELIYRDFNAPGVPQDLGPASILTADAFWAKLKKDHGHWDDTRTFLAAFKPFASLRVTDRIQLIIFWVLFRQKGHTTPKTFFETIKRQEPLASAVLDPTVSLSSNIVRGILTSIFCPAPQTQGPDNPHLGSAIPHFASPFGPSVIHCSQPGCAVQFYSSTDLNADSDVTDQIRDRRAKHFNEVYGINGAFNSLRGLPEPTQAPDAPSSYHNTLHISTARVWSRLDYEHKKAIAESNTTETGNPALMAFVKDVRIEIAERSHRGNIYSASIDAEVRAVLPSLLEALRVASGKMGLEDGSGLGYVYDWSKNKIKWKMEYELSL